MDQGFCFRPISSQGCYRGGAAHVWYEGIWFTLTGRTSQDHEGKAMQNQEGKQQGCGKHKRGAKEEQPFMSLQLLLSEQQEFSLYN